MLLLYGTKRCKQYNDMHLQGSKGEVGVRSGVRWMGMRLIVCGPYVGATKQSAPYKLSLTHTSVSRTIWSHVQFNFCLCSRNCL